jgi:hypothetical protein
MISKLLIATLAISLSAGSAAYAGQVWNETAPSIGGNGEVVSPNSLPAGFSNGTPQGQQAEAVARWFASQGETAYAANHAGRPNG